MKHLPKHLRQRWRYIAVGVETWPDTDLNRRTFQGALWDAARALLGDVGSAETDLRVLRFEFADGTGEGVVRTRRGHVETARAALACVDRVDDHPVGIRVHGISGTVRACEEKYIGERRQAGDERPVVFGNASRTARVRGDRVDVRNGDAFTGATNLDLERE